MKFAVLWAIASFLPLAVFSQEPARVTGAKIIETGIYASKVVTDATNAAGLKIQGLDQFQLLTATTNVPAQVGVRFGFRYEILGTPTNAPVILTVTMKHPPLKNSTTGQMGITDSYQLKSWIGKTYTSCSLDEKSDLVPGQWTFEIWHDGNKLCEQSFRVSPNVAPFGR